MDLNNKKYASVYTMLSTKLKFDMCIVDHRFYNIRTILILVWAGYIFFTGYTKCHTLRPIGSKYLLYFSIVKLLESVPN